MSDKEIKFTDPDQIINMGGPWIAVLTINNVKINNVIIENYLEDEDFYYFIKYFQISKKQKDNFFSILRINKFNMNMDISKDKFEKIYLESIKNDLLSFYDGFHKNLPVKIKKITW